MKTSIKTILFLVVLSAVLFFIPNFCNAETKTVTASDDTTLRNAMTQGEEDVEITLDADIDLTSPIEFSNKTVTINGNNHKIFTTKKLEEDLWPRVGNATLLTAGSDKAELILNNVNLKDSPKYGAQAYNGGKLVLNKVNISNCGFGGVISNAGIVEVQNLTLGRNGNKENVGIEIGKSSSLHSDNEPTLIMNGVLNSDEEKNVVYLAVNDALTTFDIQNTPTTTDKILASGNKVVITDAENNVKFVSNENYKDGLTLSGDEFVPNVILSIRVMYKTVDLTLAPNSKVSEEELSSKIDLGNLGYNDYVLDGFYKDADFNEAYDFETELTENTTIYAKLTAKVSTEEPKDETPKTGVRNYTGLAIFVITISTLAIAILRRR